MQYISTPVVAALVSVVVLAAIVSVIPMVVAVAQRQAVRAKQRLLPVVAVADQRVVPPPSSMP